MWQSLAVYRKSTAVYGCVREPTCSLAKCTVLFGSSRTKYGESVAV